MSLSANINVSAITVFIEGLLSFFSPCVLPLLPVYIGYLSGGTLGRDESGNTYYDRKKVFINTMFFVIGISVAFFVLALGMSALGKFLSGNQIIFARIGGIIVILLGLYQLGIFGPSKLLNSEHRIPFDISKMTMSPITALLMGFVLSFAWSPCIGPVLSSVLIMAASAQKTAGFMLIVVYTLGYIIPFVLVGLFTSTLLDFFGKHRNVVKYTVKIGGVLLVIMGLLMFSGKMNSVTNYLSSISTSEQVETQEEISEDEVQEKESVADEDISSEESSENDTKTMPAVDFTLQDQYGESHTLSDYKGKVVFLNFWATWCPPCKHELPYIQELYEEYQAMDDPDVVILGVTFPGFGNEQDVAGVSSFLEQNGYTFPVLMDEEHTLVQPYYITAYPTTFLIDKDGNVMGYVPGGMTKEMMESVIEQAKN